MASLSNGQYTVRDRGIIPLTTPDGERITARQIIVEEQNWLDRKTYGVFVSENPEKISEMGYYAIPGSIPSPEKVNPSYDMAAVFDKPAKGIPLAAAGGAAAYAGMMSGTALGALYGAAGLMSLGLMGFIPYAAKKVWDGYSGLKSYFKGEQAYYSESGRWLHENFDLIVGEFEKITGETESTNFSFPGQQAQAAVA